MSDFDYGLLEQTAHRPWPLPDRPWIMRQRWHDLLFAHWPVDSARLRGHVPAHFTLDEHDGRAWLGIIPFHMTNVAPRGLPALPWVSAFPELNVRTYVTVGDKPGVYFFSLDAANVLAVSTARALFHLPYFPAAMDVRLQGDWVHYRSRRRTADDPAAEFAARYRPVGPGHEPRPGTLEYFLTERYCLYTQDGTSTPYRLEIHHRPWHLQPAELELAVNTMTEPIGLRLPDVAPVLHFSRRQDVVVYGMERV